MNDYVFEVHCSNGFCEFDSRTTTINEITTFLPINDFLITNLLVLSSSTFVNFDILFILIITKLFIIYLYYPFVVVFTL